MNTSWTNTSSSRLDKGYDYGGGFAGRMMKMWKQKLASLEDSLKTSLIDSAWECKDNIKELSLNLLDKLRDLERHFYARSSKEPSLEEDFEEKWKASINEWKREVYDTKCELKLYLRDLIRKHCDFLTNLNQFHPEYIKWKISRIIMETNKIILANETAYEKTEIGLMRTASLLTSGKYQPPAQPEDIELPFGEGEMHDAINVNYDDYELEEVRRKRGALMIEPMEDVRTDTTLPSILEWLNRIRKTVKEPLPTFNNYDTWNRKLEIAIDHLENCKQILMNSAIEYLDSVEPHLRDELLGMKQPKIDHLSLEDRNAIERWLECISFFEFSVQNTITMVKIGVSTWNQHVCRLDTVRKLVQKIMRELLVKQDKQQVKFEQKINILLDSIREAPNREVIDHAVNAVQKQFSELEKLYIKTYSFGSSEVKEFSIGCKLAKLVFVNQAAFCHLRDIELSEFPDHGSELDIGFEPITELHHWEVIKQSYNYYANWNTGFIDGFNLLCQFEKNKEGWEALWEEGLCRHLAWVKNTKEQALKRRKERLHADIVVPRIKELEQHEAVLRSHVLGLQKVFNEKLDLIKDFKCSLLTMSHKLQREYNAIINYKNFNDVNSRSRFLGRINKFEMELKRTDEIKTSMLDYELERIKKKIVWLLKSNSRILTYVSLFNEGGSFSTSEALEFSDKVKLLQTFIVKEEEDSLESFISTARMINPTKHIDNKILNSFKHMVHYKTKKISVDEIADVILAKLKEAIRVELVTAKNYSSELCEIIGCSEVPLTSLQQLLAKFAVYLKIPSESTQFECEDFDYMMDLMEESVRKVEEKKQEDENIPDEEFSDDVKDCEQLLKEFESTFSNEEATEVTNLEITFDKLKPRVRKKSKISLKESDSSKDSSLKKKTKISNKKRNKILTGEKPTIPGERKNVLRDTKCEQLKRLNQIKKEEHIKNERNNEQNSEQDEIVFEPMKVPQKKENKDRNRIKPVNRIKKKVLKPIITKEVKTISVVVKAGNEKKTVVNEKDDEPGVDETEVMPDFAGDYLFKYTQVPIEMNVCNYLLLTKKIIFEHFVQIQKVSEKFYLSNQPHDIKKVWHEFSPKRDFKALTSRVLKALRILNIYCEHSWLLLVHDFICMMRALYCVTEERVGKEMDGMELKWKTDYGYICSESDASLTHAVRDKTIRAAQLLNQYAFTSCKSQDDWEMVQEDVKSHCNQHVDDIKTIWSNYTTSLIERYRNYKSGVLDLMKRTEDTRKILNSDKTIKAFFKELQGFDARFQKSIKQFYDKEGISELMEGEHKQTLMEQINQKNKYNEIQKIKMLQLLLQVIMAIITNFEMNYVKKKLKKGELPQQNVSAITLALKSNKVNIEARRNIFLQKIIQIIKYKNECFRRICSDQISITNSWYENWQMNNLEGA